MYPVSAVHHIDFLDVVKKPELHIGESLVESVDSILTDLPYNVRQVQKDDNSGPDGPTRNNLVHVVRFRKAVMKPGSHRHIFCSTLQLRLWLKALVKMVHMDCGKSRLRRISFETKRSARVGDYR